MLKSPKEWGAYKYVLLVHVITSAVLDQLILYGELTANVPLLLVYYPKWMFEPFCACVLITALTIFSLFIYRHQILLPENHFLRVKKIYMLLFVVFVLILSSICLPFLKDVLKSMTVLMLNRIYKVSNKFTVVLSEQFRKFHVLKMRRRK